MKNQEKGFSPEPKTNACRTRDIAENEKAMLRNEFEIMQRLDFTFIKDIGANDAEEYIVKITSLEFLGEKNPKQDN